MRQPVIAAFEIDEINAEKLWSHGITVEQTLQILEDAFVVIRNRANRAADWIIIGQNYSGSCIAVPVVGTEDPVLWRPVTAWYCKPNEWRLLPRRR